MSEQALAALPLSHATRDFIGGAHAMIVAGQDIAAQDGATMPVHDPASGRVIAEVPAGGKTEVDRAVSAARAALEGPWSRLRPVERERLILRLADAVEADGAVLAETETANNGQPLGMAQGLEVGASAEHLRYMAGWATKIYGQTLDVSIGMPPGAKYRVMTRKEPVGVVGAIVPWNFPLLMAVWKIAPALAAGCTVVLKPADETPLTALRLGQLARSVGIPEGVLNIVTGRGAEAGAALAAHPGIDKIAFTGSTQTGKLIGHAAIDNMTRLTLELGGKSPMVMFDDMDLDLLPFAAGVGVFFNQGQVCTCGSRVLVQRGIYDRVVEAFAGTVAGMTMGSGFDPSAQVNPVVSARQQAKINGMIAAGQATGATIHTNSAALPEGGFYVRPTVVTGAGPDNTLVRDEIFGPVTTIQPFDTVEEGIAMANDSVYGLSASVWTRDISRAFNVTDALKAGTVWVNAHNLVDPNMPFGGYKQSGMGREHGSMVIENYLETKSVCMMV